MAASARARCLLPWPVPPATTRTARTAVVAGALLFYVTKPNKLSHSHFPSSSAATTNALNNTTQTRNACFAARGMHHVFMGLLVRYAPHAWHSLSDWRL